MKLFPKSQGKAQKRKDCHWYHVHGINWWKMSLSGRGHPRGRLLLFRGPDISRCTMRLSQLKSCMKEFWLNVPIFPVYNFFRHNIWQGNLLVGGRALPKFWYLSRMFPKNILGLGFLQLYFFISGTHLDLFHRFREFVFQSLFYFLSSPSSPSLQTDRQSF